MKRAVAFALLCGAAIGAAPSASAEDAHETSVEPEYTLEDHSLRIAHAGSSTVVDLGCAGRSVLRSGARLFVACGPAGVIEFDLSDPRAPRRTGTMDVGGVATGLFLHDGLPWVEIAHLEARPVRVGAPAAIAPTPTPPSSPAAIQAPPSSTVESLQSEPPVDVPPGERPKESGSIVAPPRRGGLWELSLLTSAFVAFGTPGVGLLGSASVAYRFELPIVVRAEAAPFGVAGPSGTITTMPSTIGQTTTTSDRAVTVFAGHFLLGLDTQFIEVNLGIGGATVNQNQRFPQSPQQGLGAPDTQALSIVEGGRIGARDGLAVIFESSAIAANKRFDLGYFVGSFQIPLTQKLMLIPRGGGGNVGFGYGDLGLRVLVHGDGGKGTVALTGFAGVDLIALHLCSSNTDPPFTTSCSDASLAGPSLGGGAEWKP
jgi:hypothetical protein